MGQRATVRDPAFSERYFSTSAEGILNDVHKLAKLMTTQVAVQFSTLEYHILLQSVACSLLQMYQIISQMTLHISSKIVLMLMSSGLTGSFGWNISVA